MNHRLETLLTKANLKLSNTEQELLITSQFNLRNKSNLGLLLILSGGIFLIITASFATKDVLAAMIVLILGGFMSILSILSLLKQSSDYVKISSNHIEFRNSLQRRNFKLNHDMKLKVSYSNQQIKIRANTRSNFRIAEIFLKHNNKEYRVLDFQMEEQYNTEVNILGSELIQLLKKNISSTDF